MAASSWFADGWVRTYNPVTGFLDEDQTLLVTDNVAVDAQAVTRVQYQTSGITSTINAYGRIRVTYESWFGAHWVPSGGHPDNGVTVNMYVAPASSLSSTPSIIQIMTAAITSGVVLQSTTWSTAPPVDGSLDITFPIGGPGPTQLSANTKYWMALVAVQGKPGDPPAGFAPLYAGAPGRAISFWTNRTPAAPVIVTPSTNSVVPSNFLMDLVITGTDPDSMFGGATQQYTDIAGTHVQYAARATPDNPNPTWIDLPFADSGGTVRNKGWWIKDSSGNYSGDGASGLALSGGTEIKVGSVVPVAGAGLLPSGTWQIRVRTFDFGHPFPNTYPPLATAFTGGAYSPSNYPASNTSPWSTPVIITVSAQVPSPIPVWPVGNIAIPESTTVTLSWQYRNTAQPPFSQAERSIRIRRVGDEAWTDLLVSQASSSPSYAVSGFTFVSGNQYEWQVLVEDTDGVASDWSEIARFWVVAAPASGEERPLPSSTVEGATLGCGNNRVFIYRRGGSERVAELTHLSHVEWTRVRDDISLARIVVSGWDEDCGFLLSQLQPWAYEVVIIRENGFSQDRVWEGPITTLTYNHDSVEIDARDVMVYAYRRIMKQVMDDSRSGDTVVSRATRVIQNAFAPDDPNVLAYLTVLTREDDAMQYRQTPAYSRTAYEEVDDMAANAGLDYTTAGRSILVWGTKHRIGTLPEFTNANLGSPPIVSVYGMSTANLYAVSDGNGIFGEATRLDENGKDETYGLIEMLSSSWASDSAPDEGTYTQEGLNKVRESFEESAERSIASRYPPPVVVRVPDNTTINPNTVVSIQHLIPGVVIPLRSTGTLRTVVANQKLDSVRVIQQGGTETVAFTLSPFSRDDVEVEEG